MLEIAIYPVREPGKRLIRRFCIVFVIALALLPVASMSKRTAPKPVPPITENGVVYSAPNEDGRVAFVVASSAKTGKELWRLTIFETKIEAFLEEDVQWVFITRLAFKENSLLVQDEKSRCYKIDLTTRQVVKKNCYFFF
jgi:hypothetical protein